MSGCLIAHITMKRHQSVQDLNVIGVTIVCSLQDRDRLLWLAVRIKGNRIYITITHIVWVQ